MDITSAIAAKVLSIVDAGLTAGVGTPTPGKLCIQAAVCLALDLPHGDNSNCVAPSFRRLTINLNEAAWSSRFSRAKGLRKLAILQLGTINVLDNQVFITRYGQLIITKYLPLALRTVAKVHPKEIHQEALEKAAKQCESNGDGDAVSFAVKATAAAVRATTTPDIYRVAVAGNNAANAAMQVSLVGKAIKVVTATAEAVALSIDQSDEYDRVLAEFAEDIAQILIEMKVPGTQWLGLLNITKTEDQS